MAFIYAPGGGPADDWYLAKSLVTLAHEVAAAFPTATCLGTLGDDTHAAEGYASDHNPFIIAPNGKGVVRAIDIGGPDALLKQIRQHIWNLYATEFPPLWEFGYSKGCSDNLINNWGMPFGVHVDTGDAGHLHVSVTQINGNNPSPFGYMAAIDSTAPWGFAAPVPEDDNMFILNNSTVGEWLVADGFAYHIQQGTTVGAAPSTVPLWNVANATDAQNIINAANAGNSLLTQLLAAVKANPGGVGGSGPSVQAIVDGLVGVPIITSSTIGAKNS